MKMLLIEEPWYRDGKGNLGHRCNAIKVIPIGIGKLTRDGTRVCPKCSFSIPNGIWFVARMGAL